MAAALPVASGDLHRLKPTVSSLASPRLFMLLEWNGYRNLVQTASPHNAGASCKLIFLPTALPMPRSAKKYQPNPPVGTCFAHRCNCKVMLQWYHHCVTCCHITVCFRPKCVLAKRHSRPIDDLDFGTDALRASRSYVPRAIVQFNYHNCYTIRLF